MWRFAPKNPLPHNLGYLLRLFLRPSIAANYLSCIDEVYLPCRLYFGLKTIVQSSGEKMANNSRKPLRRKDVLIIHNNLHVFKKRLFFALKTAP